LKILKDFVFILELSRAKRRGRTKEERSNASSFSIVWWLQSTSQTGKYLFKIFIIDHFEQYSLL